MMKKFEDQFLDCLFIYLFLFWCMHELEDETMRRRRERMKKMMKMMKKRKGQ